MNKVEDIKCKKCSINIGILTETGTLSTILEDSTTGQKRGRSRPSDEWFGNNYVPSERIVALCISCLSVDSIIQLYIEKHSTGHTQSTLLRLVVVSNLIVSGGNITNEDMLDTVVLDNGGIIFDYSKHRHRKTARRHISYRGNSK